MADDLWENGVALADAIRKTPKAREFLRAFDRKGDLAKRVGEFTATYSGLRISRVLLGVRMNHMAAAREVIRDDTDKAWLEAAVEIGTAFQVVVEFLRSRLPGYPFLSVPHRRPGSPYLIDTDFLMFHHFPWDRELSKLRLETQGPPDLTKVGSEAESAETLHELARTLERRPTWSAFSDAQSVLSKEDRKHLSQLSKDFRAAVADDIVDREAGDLILARYRYRIAVLEEHVASASGRTLDYLRAFEEVDELITFVAGLMQTVLIDGGIAKITADRIDLGHGLDLIPADVLVRPDNPFLNPGEVVCISEQEPVGLLYADAVSHHWGRLDDPDSSVTTMRGTLVRDSGNARSD